MKIIVSKMIYLQSKVRRVKLNRDGELEDVVVVRVTKKKVEGREARSQRKRRSKNGFFVSDVKSGGVSHAISQRIHCLINGIVA